MPEPQPAPQQDWIELKPGVPWAPPANLNRIARQQGLCLAIAQAAVFDEICQAVPISEAEQQGLLQRYLEDQNLSSEAELSDYLEQRGWSQDDLLYFSSKGFKLQRFQEQVFSEEVSLRFLANKLDLDQISYSLIRVTDGDLAFELHQRLQEDEASFEELASAYSEGPERDSQGRIGPVPLNQAHEAVVNNLRTSAPGQLWPPFFLENIWLILRLDHWEGARLDEATHEALLDQLFDDWVDARVAQLLAGDQPGPLPLHLLEAEGS